ncbi:hypothetical protein LPUS_08644 [Lasallia pustulata]|uniref:Uncharacterized protein n=1 Tax=Lasallia pustulata TaxID=136370 RepID=A0A1W5D5X2_9LECA|nr:hypothetical protein LPUS_08644 [Lasallia pustulata]
MSDSDTRLLAAIIAAEDIKLDYRRITAMYGRGATCESIERCFRIIKREATALKAEAESGLTAAVKDELGGHGIISQSQIATPKKRRALKTPVKRETGVLRGRVSKSANSIPTKQRKAGATGNVVQGVKEENMMSSFSTQEMGMEDCGMDDADTTVCGAGSDNASQGTMME